MLRQTHIKNTNILWMLFMTLLVAIILTLIPPTVYADVPAAGSDRFEGAPEPHHDDYDMGDRDYGEDNQENEMELRI